MIVTRDELVQVLERRATDAEAIGATAPVAVIYQLVVEELQNLNGLPNAQKPDRCLKVEEVAGRMSVSTRYLYNHIDELPFAKRLPGNVLRFSERGLERWLSRQ